MRVLSGDSATVDCVAAPDSGTWIEAPPSIWRSGAVGGFANLASYTATGGSLTAFALP